MIPYDPRIGEAQEYIATAKAFRESYQFQESREYFQKAGELFGCAALEAPNEEIPLKMDLVSVAVACYTYAGISGVKNSKFLVVIVAQLETEFSDFNKRWTFQP